MPKIKIEHSVKKISDAFVKSDGHEIPPKWRIAISARPSVWNPETEATTHAYRILSKHGEAVVRYVLGNPESVSRTLKALLEVIEERALDRDETEFPLLSWWKK